MQFEPPLIPARLIRRYKRFLADALLEDGTEVTAHVANPGAMAGLKEEGLSIWVQPAANPKRKLQYSWILADHQNGHMSGVDTSMPNRLVAEALNEGRIEPLIQYQTIRPEQKYGENSRIDFLLSQDGRPDLYLEIKNVHFSRQAGLAEFPDSVTARGAKHLVELSNMVATGHRAVMLYVVQRTDCTRFDLAGDVDPKYAQAFDAATAAGVEVLVYDCDITPQSIRLGKRIPYGQ